jgi:glycosyltransferase involved in cell wall biosynthesis
MVYPRLAIISDSIDHSDGVSIGLRRLTARSNALGYQVHLLGPACGNAEVAQPQRQKFENAHNASIVRFAPALTAQLPFYPQMTWSLPELPALCEWLRNHADLVQISTPGPMGIAGVIAAKMLGLPLVAQYHTEVAQFAARMTGIAMLTALIEPVVGWVYQQASIALAPSESAVQTLLRLGVESQKIVSVQRGVDRDLFHPKHRERSVFSQWGIGDEPVVLYVGRLSAEKGLATLNQSWRAIHTALPTAKLLVVGDGPRPDLLQGPGIVHTGALFGTALSTVFTSADVLAFASETETFGNVVVEAASSGLPAVVVNAGAAHEHVLHGRTGEVISSGDSAAFAAAILRIIHCTRVDSAMAQQARAWSAKYDFDAAVHATWAIYQSMLSDSKRQAS